MERLHGWSLGGQVEERHRNEMVLAHSNFPEFLVASRHHTVTFLGPAPFTD